MIPFDLSQPSDEQVSYVLIKIFLYMGVWVSELVAIRLDEVDVERGPLRMTQGKASKDRQVPFPRSFRELLASHIDRMRAKGAVSLFEFVRKHKSMSL